MLRRHHGSLLWLRFERFRPSILGSLSGDVFERRTSNGSGLFPLLSQDFFKQIFGQIVFIRVKTHSNTNLLASRHVENEKSLLPVDMASLWKRHWLNSLLSHQQRKLLFHAILVLFFSHQRLSPLLNCQNTGYRLTPGFGYTFVLRFLSGVLCMCVVLIKFIRQIPRRLQNFCFFPSTLKL